MKFYQLADVPAGRDDRVFKASPRRKGIAFIVASSIGIACLVLAVNGGKHYGLPPPIFYIMAAICVLVGWIIYLGLHASLKPTNWLLRCNDSGVIIKYRSYLNWRFPEGDLQAVGLDYAEIAWVREVKERRLAPGMDQGNRSSQMEFLTFVDIALTNPDTAALEENLQAERSCRPKGLMTVMDYPVQVAPGGIIELHWNGISPAAGQAIADLGRRVTVADAVKRKVNLTHQGNSDPEKEDDKIRALVKSGNELAAIKLAQQAHGYSLSEAHQFIAKLRAGK
jgi:hypothetical protein